MRIRIGEIASTCLATGALALGLAATPASAALVDPTGDFLPVYVGPANGDLDVIRVAARLLGGGQVRLDADHAGGIGTTPGAAYVWGIDRGQGDDILADLVPSAGAGVSFDAVAALAPDGTGFVLDLIAGTPPTFLDPSAISISGGRISVTLSEALLPSTGFAFADYGYNLWPRFAPGGVNPEDNTQISDFAPDASTFVAAVPAPAGFGLLLAGLALFGAVRRSRA
jgi:hypothetical protein